VIGLMNSKSLIVRFNTLPVVLRYSS
jgi:hypothetical protein